MAIDDKRKKEVISRERAVFLKQLSLEPETHVSDIAERLGVDSDKAWSFVRAFLKIVAQEYDRDNPQFVKKWVNQYVEPELQLTDHDIANLVPLLDRYPDPSYKRVEEVNSDIVSDNSSMSSSSSATNPNDLPPNPDELNRVPGPGIPGPTQPTTDEFGQPERPIQDWGQYNVNTLNRTYDLSFLSRLTRVGLMRFVLQRVPVPPPSPRIESFVQIFSSNEDDHMVSPDTLRRELRDYFGEKTGEHAAHNFVNYIHYLPPIEQFGVRKAQGLRGMPGEGMGSPGFGAASGGFNPSSPFSMGSQFENPFDTYYHREGVLGFGMDIRSPSAMRLIWEFEQQKRRDREQERKQDKIMNEIRQSMQMQMFDFMNQLKNGKGGNGMMGGGGGYNEMVMPLLIAAMSGGSIGMEPYTDAEGKTSMRIVPQRGANMAGAAADPDRLTLRDLMEMTNQFNSRIDAKAAENQALRDGILQDLRSKLETRKDTPEMLLEYKKLFQELSPQGAGGPWAGANPLEIARVMLEKEKIVSDRERADKALERASESKKEMQAIEIEKQREANKTKNVLIKSMAGLLGNTAPMMLNLILMLTGRQPMQGVTMPGAGGGGGGAGGMLGGLANMLGPLLGGMMGGGGDGGGGLGGLFGGGSDEDEGGNGEAGTANPFAALFGGAKPKSNTGTGVPSSTAAAAAASNPASYSSIPEETYDVGDIMSSIQNMFNIGGNSQSSSSAAQAQAVPVPTTGTMPFMGFGPTGPSQEQQFSAPSTAYNRRPTVNTGMPANAFEEAETIPTQQVFQVNTNLPPYQNQFYQQRQQFSQPQPQQQQQPQQVIPIEQPLTQQQPQQQETTGLPAEEYREYTPDDFINTPKEKLAEFENEAKKSLEQTESYLKSIRAVMEGTTT